MGLRASHFTSLCLFSSPVNADGNVTYSDRTVGRVSKTVNEVAMLGGQQTFMGLCFY